MRIATILMESIVDDMLKVFDLLLADDYTALTKFQKIDLRNDIQYIKTSVANYKKDRAIWITRWGRMEIIRRLEQTVAIPLVEQIYSKIIASMKLSPSVATKESYKYSDSQVAFFHFAAHPAPELQKIDWGGKLPSALLDELVGIEQEVNARQSQIIKHTGIETLFLDVGGGWAWYNLNKSECSDESKAMGHCGNGGGDSNDTILSLRRKVGDQKYRPSLTFIWSKDGSLGEMKGRENFKPSVKYHGAVVMLLSDHRIKGITGGGYLPENNFELTDLTDAEQQAISEANPYFKTTNDMYHWWLQNGRADDMKPILKKKINELIEDKIETSNVYHRVDLDDDYPNVLINKYSPLTNYFDYCYSYTYHLYKMFQPSSPIVREMVYNHHVSPREAQSILSAAGSKLFKMLFEEILPYDFDYLWSSNPDFEINKDALRITFPLDEVLSHIEENLASGSLDDTIDEVPSLELTDSDPLIDEIIQYLKKALVAKKHDLGPVTAALYNEFSHEKNYPVKQDDYNQSELKLSA
jgi:hypothetical protein